jgi:hypothetical protein
MEPGLSLVELMQTTTAFFPPSASDEYTEATPCW